MAGQQDFSGNLPISYCLNHAAGVIRASLRLRSCDSDRAIQELKARGFLAGGQQVAIVQSGRQPIWRSASTHAIQVRQVERDPDPED